jgi:hypothetical protein
MGLFGVATIQVTSFQVHILDVYDKHAGARGGVAVEALCYKPAGRGFHSRVSLELFSDIILPVALRPWGRLSL